jgi:hypothetical protein
MLENLEFFEVHPSNNEHYIVNELFSTNSTGLAIDILQNILESIATEVEELGPRNDLRMDKHNKEADKEVSI